MESQCDVRRDQDRDEREPGDGTQHECEEQADGDVPQSLPGEVPAEHGAEADVAEPESAPGDDVQHGEHDERADGAQRRPQQPLRLAREGGDRDEEHDAAARAMCTSRRGRVLVARSTNDSTTSRATRKRYAGSSALGPK